MNKKNLTTIASIAIASLATLSFLGCFEDSKGIYQPEKDISQLIVMPKK